MLGASTPRRRWYPRRSFVKDRSTWTFGPAGQVKLYTPGSRQALPNPRRHPRTTRRAFQCSAQDLAHLRFHRPAVLCCANTKCRFEVVVKIANRQGRHRSLLTKCCMHALGTRFPVCRCLSTCAGGNGVLPKGCGKALGRAKYAYVKSPIAPFGHRHSCGRSNCCRVTVRRWDGFGSAPKLRQRTILGSDHQHLPDAASGGELRARSVLERLVQCLPTPGATLVRFAALGGEDYDGLDERDADSVEVHRGREHAVFHHFPKSFRSGPPLRRRSRVLCWKVTDPCGRRRIPAQKTSLPVSRDRRRAESPLSVIPLDQEERTRSGAPAPRPGS